MNKVYLIDDAKAEGAMSKFSQLEQFITYLTRAFTGETFEWGLLTCAGISQRHGDLLSGNVAQLIDILSDPDALILVDVNMPLQECRKAGQEILSRFPQCSARALEIGRLLGNDLTLDAVPYDYLLCAAVIAVGEVKCARVAVVSTETQQPARGAVGALGPKEIGWNAAAWNTPPNTNNIRAWVFQNILETVNQWRAEWRKLQNEASVGKWMLRDLKGEAHANCTLFRSGIAPNHDLSDAKGHFAHTAIDVVNAVSLSSATAWFEQNVCPLNKATERLSVMKAASRNSQIPIFVAQRILSIPETSDVTLAMSPTKLSWDAPAILFGLRKLASNVPKPAFDLRNGGGQWDLAVRLAGSAQELDRVEGALDQGAVRRYRDRGSTGDLTLAVELLSPTSRKREVDTIVIERSFNQQKL